MNDDVEVTQWTCVCTVYLCRQGITFQLLFQPGTIEQQQERCAAALRALGWGADRLGVLCPAHKPTHRVGPA